MHHLIDKRNRKIYFQLIMVILLSYFISFFNPFLALIASLVLILSCVYRFISQRDEKVNALSQYLKSLNQGYYEYDIEAYEEGELSKLQTELNKTTIHIQELNSKLTHQHAVLQQSLEDISHQLKTPVASLILLNELQEEDELVSKSADQLKRLSYLVSSLLRLVKMDAGVEVFETKHFTLDEVVSDATTLINPEQHDITLDVKVEALDCFGDYNKSKEAILNVLYNKLRHAKSTIYIRSKSQNMSSLLYVYDDGDPILNQDRIFERFYTGDNKDTTSIGIGLSIAQEIMQKQEGKLYIEKENTFVFSFNKI